MNILKFLAIAAGWVVVIAAAAFMFTTFGIYRIGRFCAGYGWDMSSRPLTVIEELRIRGMQL